MADGGRGDQTAAHRGGTVMDRCCPHLIPGNMGMDLSHRPSSAELVAGLVAHPAVRLAARILLATVAAAAFVAVGTVALLAILAAWTI